MADFTQTLPDELCVHILSHLDVASLAAAAQTCTNWNRLAADNSPWRAATHREFPGDPLVPALAPLTAAVGWRHTYREVARIRANWSAGRCALRFLTGHTGGVWGLDRLTDSGLLVSVGFDNVVRRWDLRAMAEVDVLRRLSAGPNNFRAVGGDLVVGIHDGAINIWDLPSRSLLACLRTPYTNLTAMRAWRASSGLRIALGTSSGDVRILHVPLVHGTPVLDEAGTANYELELDETPHEDAVRSLAVADDGSAIVSAGKDIAMFSVSPPRLVQAFPGHTPLSVSAVTFDATTVVSGSGDRTVRVWDVASGLELAVLEGHTRTVSAVAMAGSLIASGSSDGTVRVWSRLDGTLLHTLTLPDPATNSGLGNPLSLAFDPTSIVVGLRTGSIAGIGRRPARRVGRDRCAGYCLGNGSDQGPDMAL
ncbi:uncharacterized protein AMSG_06428 [Thecamonas trahens ATCC 50062]|uniref:F-box domain-containing protein n=1 Tax=Thecamonas trahens ATCC 50062 TaxID=461836 RepID=A0A0L0DD62_THETB|nr:hypothetical protein AMSG_06428 [Thecamonas trahens ATCC 50062]KNC50269.1 hypothetical protein AMSG_06428 [Thecamonas trahens ATCC 50062]|eukprot:XP_013757096.1 hypothetical protein AMSG_06428 [Thecamonas trahens ATCC 50062]